MKPINTGISRQLKHGGKEIPQDQKMNNKKDKPHDPLEILVTLKQNKLILCPVCTAYLPKQMAAHL